MGALIFGTTTIQGRKFDKIKLQTSKAGVPRQIIFGRVKPVIGNIIATTPPKIVKKKQKQKSGKGGGKTEVVNEEVYRTYAIRICEGPITGICKVWRNNELVYDRDSADPTQIDNNQAFLQLAEFFLGGFKQMPSAVLQAAFGINNVPAHRGTCYLVIDNENLTSTGGAIPQYAFEVERAEGFVLTSKPYAIEATDGVTTSPSVQGGRTKPDYTRELTEATQAGFTGISGSLREVYQSHAYSEATAAGFAGLSGYIREKHNTEIPTERVNAALASVSGRMPDCIKHTVETEAVNALFVKIEGSLE
ncbi:hypothetical protein ACJJIU_00260 [Microbulbifer sp. CnH-101-E]|uniref:hypothetical protein n=1 Tax=unclassified Microbulbifer TaxID=2619833 RepID=UPI00403915DA